MDTNAGIEPMRMTEGPSTQIAGGTKPLHRFLRGEPKTVGIVLLFLGLCMFLFGIPVNEDVLESSTDMYSPFWLGTMYFICGVLYIQSERNTTKKIVTISLAFSIISILGTIVGAIKFIKVLVLSSQLYIAQDYYNYNDTDLETEHYVLHYRLEAVFLFHSLVAGVILISMSVFARLALRSSQSKMFVVMRYPPSAE
ncbi:membrane-spanning 4-domains subfamily A member 15 [Tachysurus vachellii]|uniref:membrane-spanning 4-domains subfamily A member 15 n=1 Tax=Tachysurus vachellii TaxID=175792 RepID=UPI00296AF7D7|nr:membrane-spanning 4-domains subfamily A member 15 [Tachysurus vachellii]